MNIYHFGLIGLLAASPAMAGPAPKAACVVEWNNVLDDGTMQEGCCFINPDNQGFLKCEYVALDPDDAHSVVDVPGDLAPRMIIHADPVL